MASFSSLIFYHNHSFMIDVLEMLVAEYFIRYLIIRFLERYQKEYGMLVSDEVIESMKR